MKLKTFRSDEVHRIQNLMEDKINAFEKLLSLKQGPYPIERFDFRKNWIRPKATSPPRPDYLPKSECPELDEPVDAVYTWVNGSDPDFQNSLKGTKFDMKVPNKEDMHNQRFEGKGSIL